MPNKIKRTQEVDINSPHGRDLFQTPNYAVDLLVPLIPKGINNVWECAAGERKIADRLEHWGYTVHASDIRGLELEKVTPENFLTDKIRTDIYRKPYIIITNPPFSLKKQFYERCLESRLPFALLIPCDYCLWLINAIRDKNCEKIIPDSRINYITPSGLSEVSGHTANFHSMWLTKGFGLGRTETFVALTKEMKKNI